MNESILFNDEAKNALVKGINILAEAVAVTMGPKGRNVVLAKNQQTPQIINDGVTVAQEISLKNCIENAGAALVKEAAAKTNETAGDGTTTATVLAHNMIKQGLQYTNSGINTMKLKTGILKSVKFVTELISECAKPIQNSSDIIQIATISANNDKEIGRVIADAFCSAGREGIISLEEGKSTQTELEVTEGMQFDKGFMSPYFSDNTNNSQTLTKDNPYLLLTDQELNSVSKEIIPILELIIKQNKPLIIMARDIENKALSTLIMNYLQNKIDVVAIKAPGFGDEVTNFLEDIATLTKGTLITKESGIKFNQIKLEMLGKARQVTTSKDSTTIIANKQEKVVQERCHFIRKQIEISDSLYEKEKLENRLAKLSGSVAIVRIGAKTEVEMQNKKLRFEDALNATRAAISEGIIPGGGCTLAHIAIKLKDWAEKYLSEEEQLGALVISNSLVAPIKRIAYNSGKNGNFVLDKLYSYPRNIGYNAQRDEYKDLFKIGIIDPAKVTRCALQNAASVASMILTTECVIPELN
uniref:chaperonin GroEL n=1 Tax=Goniotrichopsis reniformis TaxID=468933 RepID=UPI001FCDC020|nr:chaperonin GroEL [Goniotrichopsis reniformis]UNJ14703.1 chaperonin GroEL [Goniotrichopsis reniformis]